MITKLKIKNFRCFKEHTIDFRPITIVVGKNNVGKSTIVEILKMVAVITQRYKNLNYKKPPIWLDLPPYVLGVSPSIKKMHINTKNIFHEYGEPPAKVTAYFHDGQSIELYIGPEFEMYAILLDKKGRRIKNKGAPANSLQIMSVLPQVAPLNDKEMLLDEAYVNRYVSAPISYLHFRNQLKIDMGEYWDEFKKMAEDTWSGLEIQSLEVPSPLEDKEPLNLLVRDRNFVTEIACMGHGLQMWLQTMWFLARTKNTNTIVLDEPDVYMHADLQRKLIRLLKKKSKQIIIATHSVEIMAEVDPKQILVVDRESKESSFLTSAPGLQGVIDNIGGVTNLQISRLWGSKRCIIVEGKDVKYLSKLSDLLYPEADALENIPNFPIGGWGGWRNAIGSEIAIKNTFDKEVKVYCIFDRDYHPNKEVQKREKEAEERKIELHVWSKKEIENHLIKAEVIKRIIFDKTDKRTEVSSEEITNKLMSMTEELKDEIVDDFSEEIYKTEKCGHKNANKRARELVNSSWESLEKRLCIVPGKTLIKRISEWCLSEHGFTINPMDLLEHTTAKDIDEEIKMVIKSIRERKEFQKLIA